MWFYWQVDINDKWLQNYATILLVTKIPTFWFASKYVYYLLPFKMTDEFPVCNAWYWRSSINGIDLWKKANIHKKSLFTVNVAQQSSLLAQPIQGSQLEALNRINYTTFHLQCPFVIYIPPLYGRNIADTA